jgi:hypothetical protein
LSLLVFVLLELLLLPLLLQSSLLLAQLLIEVALLPACPPGRHPSMPTCTAGSWQQVWSN